MATNRYHPGACASCYKSSMDLLVCSKCKMANYCDKVCQKKHWKGHELVCMFAEKIRTSYYDEVRKNIKLAPDELFAHIDNFLYKKMEKYRVQNIISRKQLSIFFHPRICSCGVYDRSKLTPCRECFSVFYCRNDHFDERTHSNFCQPLKLIRDCYIIRADGSYKLIIQRNYNVTINPVKSDMNRFMKKITGMDISNHPTKLTVLSIEISFPVTVLHALNIIPRKFINFHEEYVIHIIGGEKYDQRCDVLTWQNYFFPYLPKSAKVKLICVGYRLCRHNEDGSIIGRKYSIETYGMHYNDYYASSFYTKPNVFVAFNTDLLITESIKDIILADLGIPIILTSLFSENRGKLVKDLDYFSKLRRSAKFLLLPTDNPFYCRLPLSMPFRELSLMKSKHFPYDDMPYANKCLGVVI